VNSTLNSALGWTTSTFGAVALVASVGYVIGASFQDRLGYAIEPGLDISANVALTGRFAASLVLEPVRLAGDFFVHFAGLSLAAAVAAHVVRRGTFDAAVRRLEAVQWRTASLALSPHARLGIAVVALTLTKAVLLDAPNLAVSDLLVKDVRGFQALAGEDVPTMLGQRVYVAQVCARVADEVPGEVLESAGLTCAGPEGGKQRRAERFLRALYVTNTLASVGILALAFSSPGRRQAPARPAAAAWVAVVGLCAVAAAMSVPSHYARAIMPTVFDEVIVDRDGGGEGPTQPHGFLLALTDSRATLYAKQDRHLWTLPGGKWTRIQTERRGDVLKAHFKAGLGDIVPR
jgi:hypothetical protein